MTTAREAYLSELNATSPARPHRGGLGADRGMNTTSLVRERGNTSSSIRTTGAAGADSGATNRSTGLMRSVKFSEQDVDPRVANYVARCHAAGTEPVLEIVVALQDASERSLILSDRRTPLTEEEFRLACDALQDAHSVETLLAVGLDLGMDAVRALGGVLANNEGLQKLDFSENHLGSDGLLELARSMRGSPALRELVLRDNGVGNHGAHGLAQVLMENDVMTVVDLQRNNIKDHGAISLSSMLKVNLAMRILNLRFNQVGDTGSSAVGSVLAVNNTLSELDLGGNAVGNDGAVAVAEGVGDNNSLKKLNLRSNKIGFDGACGFADTAIRRNTVLEELFLGGNPEIGNDGVVAVLDSVRESPGSALVKLDLQNVRLEHSGALALADLLRSEGIKLREIILDGICDLPVDDQRIIAEAIKTNIVITDLLYGDPGKMDPEARDAIDHTLRLNKFVRDLLSRTGFSVHFSRTQAQMALRRGIRDAGVLHKLEEEEAGLGGRSARGGGSAEQRVISALSQKIQGLERKLVDSATRASSSVQRPQTADIRSIVDEVVKELSETQKRGQQAGDSSRYLAGQQGFGDADADDFAAASLSASGANRSGGGGGGSRRSGGGGENFGAGGNGGGGRGGVVSGHGSGAADYFADTASSRPAGVEVPTMSAQVLDELYARQHDFEQATAKLTDELRDQLKTLAGANRRLVEDNRRLTKENALLNRTNSGNAATAGELSRELVELEERLARAEAALKSGGLNMDQAKSVDRMVSDQMEALEEALAQKLGGMSEDIASLGKVVGDTNQLLGTTKSAGEAGHRSVLAQLKDKDKRDRSVLAQLNDKNLSDQTMMERLDELEDMLLRLSSVKASEDNLARLWNKVNSLDSKMTAVTTSLEQDQANVAMAMSTAMAPGPKR